MGQFEPARLDYLWNRILIVMIDSSTTTKRARLRGARSGCGPPGQPGSVDPLLGGQTNGSTCRYHHRFDSETPGSSLAFPSRRAVLADATVEVAAVLLGLPAPLHVIIGLVAHVVFAHVS